MQRYEPEGEDFFLAPSDGGTYVLHADAVAAIDAALAAERERCAKLVEPAWSRPGGSCCSVREFDALTYAALMIRGA